jgi:hypothetical protein
MQHINTQHMAPDNRGYHTNAAIPNSYATAPQRRYDYSYSAQATTQTPSAPPSPPVDEANKPSLPSIQSLLGMSEGKHYECSECSMLTAVSQDR